LYEELQIGEVVSALRSGEIPDKLQTLVVPLATTILDLFGTGTPGIGIDPISTLKSASRDINLSRILRERGLFRLFRLLNTNDEHNVPIYQTLTNPDDGSYFERREDMIGWFCKSAKVSRSVVFMRMATIEKLLGLGYELDDCYKTILTKPYAIRETLNEIAEWQHNELEYVDPEIALRLAEKYYDDAKREKIGQLVETIADPKREKAERDQAQDELTDAMRPAISKLVDEVAAHQDTKDAMDFVRADIAGKPEISFSWDYERDELVCEVIVKGKKAGTEYIKDILTIRLAADQLMPVELRDELVTRLPIKNRIRDD
jgi:hypothetical protein